MDLLYGFGGAKTVDLICGKLAQNREIKLWFGYFLKSCQIVYKIRKKKFNINKIFAKFELLW